MSGWTDNGFPNVELLPTYNVWLALFNAWGERAKRIYGGRYAWLDSMKTPAECFRELTEAILETAMRSQWTEPGYLSGLIYHNYELWMCDLDHGDLSGLGKTLSDFKAYVLERFCFDMDEFALYPTSNIIRGLYGLINSIRYGYVPANGFYIDRREYKSNPVPPDVPRWGGWDKHTYFQLHEWTNPFMGLKLGNYDYDGIAHNQNWFLENSGFSAGRNSLGTVKGGISRVIDVNGMSKFEAGKFYYMPVINSIYSYLLNPVSNIEPPDETSNATVTLGDIIAIHDYSTLFQYYDPPEG